MPEKFIKELTKIKGFLNDIRVYLEFNKESFIELIDKIIIAKISLNRFAKD